jgi:hypothetical protein
LDTPRHTLIKESEKVDLCLSKENTVRVKKMASIEFLRRIEYRRVFHRVSRDSIKVSLRLAMPYDYALRATNPPRANLVF